ncbi:MAG: hypothetical protein KKC20_16570, partial [Proteobacteria bacterium]|nr:hypothetical protein [Pseudomonadota bacterium]
MKNRILSKRKNRPRTFQSNSHQPIPDRGNKGPSESKDPGKDAIYRYQDLIHNAPKIRSQASLQQRIGSAPSMAVQKKCQNLFKAARTASAKIIQRNQLGRNLTGYQKELVTWAVEKVDPSMNERLASARDVYEAVRHEIWHSHRGQVIRFMARGDGLDETQAETAVEKFNLFSREERLRLRTWLTGPGEESTKLNFIGGLGRGKVFAWTDPRQALAESSVLPGNYTIAYNFAKVPDLSNIRTLDQVKGILDYWEVAARAYVECMVQHRELSLELAEKQVAQGIFSSNILRGKHKSLRLWQSGGPPYIKEFIHNLQQLRDRADEGKRKFKGLEKEDAKDEPDQGAINSVLAEGRPVLEILVATLSAIQPTAMTLISGIRESRADISNLRRQIAQMQPASFWSKTFDAVGEMLQKAIKVITNPQNLLMALEIGLEIAGAVFTGGASVVIRVVKWLATTGIKIKELVTGMIPQIKAYASLEALKKFIPFQHLFSGSAFFHNIILALFGKFSLSESAPAETVRARPARTADRGDFVGRIAARIQAIAALFRRIYRKIHRKTGQLLSRIDLTKYGWFRQLARYYVRIMHLKSMAGNAMSRANRYVGRIKDRIMGLLGGITQRAKQYIGILAKPVKWLKGVVTAGVEYLLNLLITNPPSAVLKAAFRAIQATAGTSLIDLVKQHVPMASTMIKKMAESVSGWVGGLIENPMEKLAQAAKDLFDTRVVPIINSIKGVIDDVAASGYKFLNTISGGRFAKAKARQANSPAQRAKAGTGKVGQASRTNELKALLSPTLGIEFKALVKMDTRLKKRYKNLKRTRALRSYKEHSHTYFTLLKNARQQLQQKFTWKQWLDLYKST